MQRMKIARLIMWIFFIGTFFNACSQDYAAPSVNLPAQPAVAGSNPSTPPASAGTPAAATTTIKIDGNAESIRLGTAMVVKKDSLTALTGTVFGCWPISANGEFTVTAPASQAIRILLYPKNEVNTKFITQACPALNPKSSVGGLHGEVEHVKGLAQSASPFSIDFQKLFTDVVQIIVNLQHGVLNGTIRDIIGTKDFRLGIIALTEIGTEKIGTAQNPLNSAAQKVDDAYQTIINAPTTPGSPSTFTPATNCVQQPCPTTCTTVSQCGAGGTCSTGNQCTSGICTGGACTATCAGSSPCAVGGTCSSAGQCTSNACAAGACVANCGGGGCVNGSTCAVGANCTSTKCTGNVCVP